MVSVDDYKTYVRDNVFPTQLNSLYQCNSGPEITRWRKAVNEALMSRIVVGELPDVVNP